MHATPLRPSLEDQYRNRLQAQACMQYVLQQPVTAVVVGDVHTWGPSLLDRRLDKITQCMATMPTTQDLESWLEQLHTQLYDA